MAQDSIPLDFLGELRRTHNCGELRPSDVGQRAVVYQRSLVATTVFDVAIDCVVTGIDHAAGKPTVERRVVGVEHAIPFLVPVNRLRLGRPIHLWISLPRCVSLRISAGHLAPYRRAA